MSVTWRDYNLCSDVWRWKNGLTLLRATEIHGLDGRWELKVETKLPLCYVHYSNQFLIIILTGSSSTVIAIGVTNSYLVKGRELSMHSISNKEIIIMLGDQLHSHIAIGHSYFRTRDQWLKLVTDLIYYSYYSYPWRLLHTKEVKSTFKENLWVLYSLV